MSETTLDIQALGINWEAAGANMMTETDSNRHAIVTHRSDHSIRPGRWYDAHGYVDDGSAAIQPSCLTGVMGDSLMADATHSMRRAGAMVILGELKAEEL